ncbi:Uncharacterized protein TCM_015258 [Theobroma cacao]|uniref:Uncharacterized protein n=1 Tax=Theobroma cacao TaxID=3641 RepID=A0A061G181_THECC|nr:Uncharacterized protein TCM_015258 [Theobroma cacao]
MNLDSWRQASRQVYSIFCLPVTLIDRISFFFLNEFVICLEKRLAWFVIFLS